MSSNPDEELTRLFEAVSYFCDTAKVAAIIDSGVDINCVTKKGYSLLMDICNPDRYGDYNSALSIDQMARFLIKRGADVSLIDSDGLSALDYLKCWTDPTWLDEAGGNPLGQLSERDVYILTDLEDYMVSLLGDR